LADYNQAIILKPDYAQAYAKHGVLKYLRTIALEVPQTSEQQLSSFDRKATQQKHRKS
jgi:hypothetical protein